MLLEEEVEEEEEWQRSARITDCTITIRCIFQVFIYFFHAYLIR